MEFDIVDQPLICLVVQPPNVPLAMRGTVPPTTRNQLHRDRRQIHGDQARPQ